VSKTTCLIKVSGRDVLIRLNSMSYTIIFGGTGFIGRVFTRSGLLLQKKIIIVSRKKGINDFLNALSFSQEKSKNYFGKAIANGRILPILGEDYSSKNNLSGLLERLNLKYPGVLNKVKAVVNLSGNTSGGKQEIIDSQVGVAEGLLFLKRKLVFDYSTNPVFVHMGSVAARYPFTKLPPYEEAKKRSEEIIKNRGGCDYNILAGYVKGVGEEKMSKAASHVIKIFTPYFNLFFLKASVVDVERLAAYLWYLVDYHKNIREEVRTNSCLDVFVSNGSLGLGEVICSLLPEDHREKIKLPTKKKFLFNLWERIILWVDSFCLELIYSQNQEKRRIASFKKLASLRNRKNFIRKYNNLIFFGKPRKEERLVKINLFNQAKKLFKKLDFEYPKQLFNSEENLLYLIERLEREKIISFISKSVNNL